MSDIVKVYVNNYPSYAIRTSYINKRRINLIEVVKDSYSSYKFHVYISVGDCKETLDIVKDSKGSYWKDEKDAEDFIEKTFGNSTMTTFESLESL